MSKTVTIDREKILEAAKGCPQAKIALQTLFPEVFEEDEYFDLSKFPRRPFNETESENAGFYDNSFLQVRIEGSLEYKAFYLSSAYNWRLQEDSLGALCLLPTKDE